VPYRREKLTFAISSPDEFLYWYVAHLLLDNWTHISNCCERRRCRRNVYM